MVHSARARLTSIVVALIICAFLAGPVSAEALQSDTKVTTISERIHTVVVRNDIGRVEIVPGRPTRVHETRRWNYDEPTVAISRSNGVLTVTGICPSGPSVGPLTLGGGFNDCSIDLRLEVPAVVNVRAAVGLGDLRVRDLSGSQVLRSDVGSIDVRRVTAPSLEARSDLGDVTLAGIRASRVLAESDNGSVSVGLARPARRLSGLTDTGDVSLRVPAGRYDLTTATELGEVVVRGILRDGDAARRIVARSDVGDVHVLGVAP
jgi:hypothetical protein